MSREACPPCVFVPHPPGRSPVVTLRCPRAQRDQRGIADSQTIVPTLSSCPRLKLGPHVEAHLHQALVMEYLEGDTLDQRLTKGALPLDQALRYAVEIADALDKAHRQGIQ